MTIMFFKSPQHKAGFLTAMQALGRVYDDRLDQEYGVALYILTADISTWEKAQDYIDSDGIDFGAMVREVDFSHGYSVLIKWAWNLFNGQTHIDPIELMRLDDSNFAVAVTALQIRRKSLHRDDFNV